MSESLLVTWLRRLIYASAFIPLVIFAQYMSPFHFGKVVVFRSIVQVMIMLYLLLVLRDRSYLPKSNPITWAFLAFTAAFTLTSIFSVAPLQSFWGTLERMGGLFTFWHYLAFYVITASVLRTRHDWQMLLDIIISVGVISALYGFLQRFNITTIIGSGGRQRIFGTIGNPALFAGYQLLIAYLALTFSFLRRMIEVPTRALERGTVAIIVGVGAALLVGLLATPLVWLQGLWVIPMGYAMYGVLLCVAGSAYGARWFYGGAAGVTFFAAGMTAVRGSLLAMVVASLLFALLWSVVNNSRKAKRVLLFGMSGIIVLVFLAIALRDTSFVKNSPYLNRVTDFSSQTKTVQTRFWAWSAGLKGFVESPKTVLLGWGPENFNVPFSEHFNPKFYTGPGAETFFDRAHNMFIEVLVTMGAVGELAYLTLFGAVFWMLVRIMKKPGEERLIGIGFTSLVVAYMIHNAFIFDTSANFITFFTLMAFIPFLSFSPEDVRERNVRKPYWTGMQKTAAGVLLVVAVIMVYATNVRPALANFTVTRAIVAGWQNDWNLAVQKYRKAIGYDTPGRYEYRHRFAQYQLEVAGNTDISKSPDFTTVTLEVIQEIQKNVRENPMDYLPRLYISRLYLMLGKGNPTSEYNDLALQYSMSALKISPTFVRTYHEIAQAYLNKNDSKTALEWFKKAMKLNPAVNLTYWYMGSVRYQIAEQAHDAAGIREAISYFRTALEYGYAPSEGDSQKLITAYLRVDDIASTIPLFERLTVLRPENAQYWASLAAAYSKVGRTADAISAARKFLQLSSGDTGLKAQAEAFIRSLGGTP